MNILNTLKTVTIAGNELWRIAALFCCVLLALIVARLARVFMSRAASHCTTGEKKLKEVALRSAGGGVLPLLFAWGLARGCSFLSLQGALAGWVDSVLSVLLSIGVAYLLYSLVDVVDVWLRRFADSTASTLDDMLVPMVRKSLRVTIVVLAMVQIAQSLSDKPITSILAGLGVGGVAIALAAKDTVANFFGSLVILADKPFEFGDRIKVDGQDGSVVEVGFRSTRIKRLDGHLVTIPNGALANMTIENVSKRPHIKRVMDVTVTYDTPPDKMERAIEIIKDILNNHEGMNPDFPPRVFFSDFNDWALNIRVFYWYHPAEYWDYMAFSQQFNMDLLRRFNDEGIEFAFPTQTAFLAGDPARALKISSQ